MTEEGFFEPQRAYYASKNVFGRWAFPLLILKTIVLLLVERFLEWLSPSCVPFSRAAAEAALQRAGRLAPGAHLDGYTQKRLSTQGDVGLVERVEVTYGGTTERFILKSLGLSFKEAVQSSLMRANKREHFAYTRLAEAVPSVVSRSLFVTCGRAGTGQVLMPDYSHMRHVANAQGCSAADARLLMLELARLHAATWANRGGLCKELASFAKDLNAFTADYPNTFAKVKQRGGPVSFATLNVPQVLSAAPEFFAAPKFEKYARDGCDWKTLGLFNDQGDPQKRKQLVCIVHADARLDNLFLSNDKCQLVDWGIVSVAGPGRDIAWFWANDLEPDVLREHKDALLNTYVSELNAAGGLSVTVKEIEDDVRYYARAIPTWFVVAMLHIMHNEENRKRLHRVVTARVPALLDALGL